MSAPRSGSAGSCRPPDALQLSVEDAFYAACRHWDPRLPVPRPWTPRLPNSPFLSPLLPPRPGDARGRTHHEKQIRPFGRRSGVTQAMLGCSSGDAWASLGRRSGAVPWLATAALTSAAAARRRSRTNRPPTSRRPCQVERGDTPPPVLGEGQASLAGRRPPDELPDGGRCFRSGPPMRTAKAAAPRKAFGATHGRRAKAGGRCERRPQRATREVARAHEVLPPELEAWLSRRGGFVGAPHEARAATPAGRPPARRVAGHARLDPTAVRRPACWAMPRRGAGPSGSRSLLAPPCRNTVRPGATVAAVGLRAPLGRISVSGHESENHPQRPDCIGWWPCPAFDGKSYVFCWPCLRWQVVFHLVGSAGAVAQHVSSPAGPLYDAGGRPQASELSSEL